MCLLNDAITTASPSAPTVDHNHHPPPPRRWSPASSTTSSIVAAAQNSPSQSLSQPRTRTTRDINRCHVPTHQLPPQQTPHQPWSVSAPPLNKILTDAGHVRPGTMNSSATWRAFVPLIETATTRMRCFVYLVRLEECVDQAVPVDHRAGGGRRPTRPLPAAPPLQPLYRRLGRSARRLSRDGADRAEDLGLAVLHRP